MHWYRSGEGGLLHFKRAVVGVVGRYSECSRACQSMRTVEEKNEP